MNKYNNIRKHAYSTVSHASFDNKMPRKQESTRPHVRTWSTLVFSHTDTSGALWGGSAGTMLLSDVRRPPNPPARWINTAVWLNATCSPFVLCVSAAHINTFNFTNTGKFVIVLLNFTNTGKFVIILTSQYCIISSANSADDGSQIFHSTINLRLHYTQYDTIQQPRQG